MITEPDLLLGALALHRGFIDDSRFARALLRLFDEPENSLASILVEEGWMTRAEVADLEKSLHGNQGSNLSTEVDTEAPTVPPGADPENGFAAILDNGFASGPSTENSLSDSFRTRDWSSTDNLISSLDLEPDGPFGRRYIDVTFHAEGGVGQVWKAIDTVTGRVVALKILRPDRLHDDLILARFLEEARTTARLEHPNIVPMHELSEFSERPFYSMRFLGNHTLKEAVRDHFRKDEPDNGLGLRQLLENFLGVCNAIAHAHEKGVIHRDLKGQNVILGPFGESIVLDWGLARRLDQTEPAVIRQPRLEEMSSVYGETLEGQPIGTLNYMSPEAAAGVRERINERSDIFGLGAILYLILTGRPPYSTGSFSEVLAQAIEASPPPPRSVRPTVPPALESICLKAIHKNPEDRYVSAVDLADDVRRWLADEPVSAHPDTLRSQTFRWARRNRPIVAGAAVFLLASVVSLSILNWRAMREAENLREAKDTAENARINANADLGSAVNLLNQVFAVLSTELVTINDPRIDLVRLKLAKSSSVFASNIADRHKQEPSIQVALGTMLRELATLHKCFFQHSEAENFLRRAIDALRSTGREEALDSTSRDRLIEYHIELGKIQSMRGDLSAATITAGQSQERVRAMRIQFPTLESCVRTEARVHLLLGDLDYKNGAIGEALREYKLALDGLLSILPTPRMELFDGLLRIEARWSLGVAILADNRPQAAIDELSKAERDVRDLLAGRPDDIDLRQLRDAIAIDSAIAHETAGHRSLAVRNFDDAIAGLDQLVRERPNLSMLRVMSLRARVERMSVVEEGRSEQALIGLEAEAARLLAATNNLPQVQFLRASAAVSLAGCPAAPGDAFEHADRELMVLETRQPNLPELKRVRGQWSEARKRASKTPRNGPN